MQNNQINQLNKLFKTLPNLDPLELSGVFTLLGIPLFDEDGKPRQIDTLLEELIEKFPKASRKTRRRLFKIAHVATKGDDN